MILWDVINSLGRVAITTVVVIVLVKFKEALNLIQRLGLGLMGGGSFLTVSIIWEGQRSPYDGWSVTALTYGLLAFMVGTVYRYWRHEHNNQLQLHIAATWKSPKGPK